MVGYIAVTVGWSKKFRRPTSNFWGSSTKRWSSISGRSRVDLSRISDLGSISGRSRVDLGPISRRSRPTEIKIT
eukprot:2517753-Prymnesium_polylepis.1